MTSTSNTNANGNTTNAPKKPVTAVSAAVDNYLLTLTFANGKSLIVDAEQLPLNIHRDALMHGLKQKLIDAAAIARNPDNGATATIEDKYAAVKEVFDRITAPEGTWNKVRVGGEGGGNKGGMLVKAMMRLTSKPRDFVMTYLDARSKEEIAALRKNPRIIEIMAQLQSEQANTSGVDSDALLDGLMEGENTTEEGHDIPEDEQDLPEEGYESVDMQPVEELKPAKPAAKKGKKATA